MQKEITQKLTWTQKFLLGYRGIWTLAAILILIFTSVFLIKPFKGFDLREYIRLHSNTGFAKAVITDVLYTGVVESISSNDYVTYYDVKAYQYDYKVNGEEHRWTSYGRNKKLKIGSKVGIIYNKDNPAYSKIINYRTQPNSSPIYYLLFLLPSIFILIYHFCKGIYFYYIIKNGVLTKARLVKKRIENSDNDDAPDKYELTFEYSSGSDKKYRKVISKYDPEKFEDEFYEYLIYRKKDPYTALLVDDLPESIADHIKKNWV